MSGDAPTVSLALASLPENLTLVRGTLSGIGESLGMDAELLDDVKTAVSEAANNVVMHAYDGEPGPLTLELFVRTEGIEVVVKDWGAGIPDIALVSDRLHGVGVPVIEALAANARFTRRPNGGTEVRMLFAAQRDGRPLFGVPPAPAPDDGWTRELAGDAVVSLSPLTLLTAVLGRLSRALAASARFSLDRFSDVYLVTDAIAGYAARTSVTGRIGFVLQAAPRRLEMRIGPFRPGTSSLLTRAEPTTPQSALLLLSDTVTTHSDETGESLNVVMVDHREP